MINSTGYLTGFWVYLLQSAIFSLPESPIFYIRQGQGGLLALSRPRPFSSRMCPEHTPTIVGRILFENATVRLPGYESRYSRPAAQSQWWRRGCGWFCIPGIVFSKSLNHLQFCEMAGNPLCQAVLLHSGKSTGKRNGFPQRFLRRFDRV